MTETIKGQCRVEVQVVIAQEHSLLERTLGIKDTVGNGIVDGNSSAHTSTAISINTTNHTSTIHTASTIDSNQQYPSHSTCDSGASVSGL